MEVDLTLFKQNKTRFAKGKVTTSPVTGFGLIFQGLAKIAPETILSAVSAAASSLFANRDPQTNRQIDIPEDAIVAPRLGESRTDEECRAEARKRADKAAAIGYFAGCLTMEHPLLADHGAGSDYLFNHSEFGEIRAKDPGAFELFRTCAVRAKYSTTGDDLAQFLVSLCLTDQEICSALAIALSAVTVKEIKLRADKTAAFKSETNTRRSLDILRKLLSVVTTMPGLFARLRACDGCPLRPEEIEYRIRRELDAQYGVNGSYFHEPALSQKHAKILREFRLAEPVTREQVERIRRELARKHHPDRAPPDERPAATALMSDINAKLDELMAIAA